MPVKSITPLHTEIKSMRKANQYTPDAWHLAWRYAYVPLFIYGTAQHGFSDHRVMRGFPCVGQGFTVNDCYTMYIEPKEHEPVVVEEELSSLKRGHVIGEVYITPPEIIKDLDNYYCQGEHYTRRWVDIEYYSDIEKQSFKIKAMSWFGIYKNWSRYLVNGCRQHRSTIESSGRWYRFTFADDKPNRELLKEMM